MWAGMTRVIDLHVVLTGRENGRRRGRKRCQWGGILRGEVVEATVTRSVSCNQLASLNCLQNRVFNYCTDGKQRTRREQMTI